MFRIGICDDEKETCKELKKLLEQYADFHQIELEVNMWYTGESLCNSLKKENAPDMLFLDIELISTDGIAVGSFIREELENMEISIIYISSKSSYAMSLFRTQPLDFLIKPLTSRIIENIMNRGIKIYERKRQFFEYSTKGYHYRIPFKDILYFYSENKKINIVMKKEEMQLNGKLKDVAKTVPHNFILIHQSYLINLDFVEECSYDVMKMQNGALLNISQPYRKSVREQVMQNEWEKIK